MIGAETKIQKVAAPARFSSYFKLEAGTLAVVTVSGILYNFGMVAGPYFEGKLAQCLFDIMRGTAAFSTMLRLAALYLAVIFAVQLLRCVKRFYVRRFANNTSRNMRHMLYNSLVNQSRAELAEESIGTVMTKAVADVDACVEGMRKFTTEVFDTGVALAAYLVMLFYYDWRLALLSCAFPPIAYGIAGRLKRLVTRYNAAYKKSAGRLNSATMDRVSNAVTYRVYGCEPGRDTAYEGCLRDYEKRAVAANFFESTMQPLYHSISMCGVVLILYFGGKNVLGTGWCGWDIAAFTTFLSCFGKMAIKSSKAAKLFNAVQKAQVSWARIQPLMQEYQEPDTHSGLDFSVPVSLAVKDVSLRWPGGQPVLQGLSFTAKPGEIIGVTGAVASGKSMLGKALLGELPYEGKITLNGHPLRSLTLYERSRLIGYAGHEPELLSESVAENIRLGKDGALAACLRATCLTEEIAAMPQGEQTSVGSGGIRLSGGQQARLALARTLYNAWGSRQILILDDPFSAVDPKTEEEIFAQLRLLAADRIVILISHRLRLFPRLDGLLFLENGTGVFSNHAALLQTNPNYARLYQAQTAGGDRDEE